LRRFATGVLLAIPACIIGAVCGGVLVSMFSSNTHDRSLEAAMTGAFFIGPICGILGFIAGIFWSGARSSKAAGERDEST